MIFAITFGLGIVACRQNATAIKLNAPQNLHINGRTLIWDEDENASFYVVSLEFTEHTTNEASFDLSELRFPNTYEIEVMAVGDAINYDDSDWVKFSYTPEEILSCGYDERGLKYTLLEDGSGYEVSRGSLSYNDDRLKGFIDIPDYFCGLPVKTVADKMFYSEMLNIDPSTGYGCNTVITGVHLPKKLESIGSCAFRCCISLEEINIPSTVTSIGEDAFAYVVKLEEIDLPYGLKTVGSGVFNHTDITKAILPENVVSIGNAAFAFCQNLEEVILPNDLEAIGAHAFEGCSSLIKVSAPQTITRLEDYAFRDCSALSEIPVFNKLEYMGMEVFERTAWYQSQPNGFVIYGRDILYRYKGALPEGGAIKDLPAQVKYIAGGAFAELSDLTSVSLPDDVKIIGDRAFYQCNSLISVRLPQELVRINMNTFHLCTSLQFIEIPEGVTTIEALAFNSSKLAEIILPSSLKTIGESAFAASKLKTIFYAGTLAQWQAISIEENNSLLDRATVCIYSESKPIGEGTYWHYVDGRPVIW